MRALDHPSALGHAECHDGTTSRSMAEPLPKLRIGKQWTSTHHRSGWPYVIDALRDLHSDDGVLFEGFIEKKFAWGRDPGDRYNAFEPHRAPWIGVLHNPPGIPAWF